MTKYNCGHSPEATILDDNSMSIMMWHIWKDSCGYDGDKSLCFQCYCEKEKRRRHIR